MLQVLDSTLFWAGKWIALETSPLIPNSLSTLCVRCAVNFNEYFVVFFKNFRLSQTIKWLKNEMENCGKTCKEWRLSSYLLITPDRKPMCHSLPTHAEHTHKAHHHSIIKQHQRNAKNSSCSSIFYIHLCKWIKLRYSHNELNGADMAYSIRKVGEARLGGVRGEKLEGKECKGQ